MVKWDAINCRHSDKDINLTVIANHLILLQDHQCCHAKKFNAADFNVFGLLGDNIVCAPLETDTIFMAC